MFKWISDIVYQRKLEQENKRLSDKLIDQETELLKYKSMGTPEEINKKMCILDNQVSLYEKDLKYMIERCNTEMGISNTIKDAYTNYKEHKTLEARWKQDYDFRQSIITDTVDFLREHGLREHEIDAFKLDTLTPNQLSLLCSYYMVTNCHETTISNTKNVLNLE